MFKNLILKKFNFYFKTKKKREIYEKNSLSFNII